MDPVILIIERRSDVALAIEEVVTSAHYFAVVRPHIERLTDLDVVPSAIIVRIAFEGIGEPAHAAIGRLPADRPPVIAIAWKDADVDEAKRLKFEVVLRAPRDVGRLCEALTSVVNA